MGEDRFGIRNLDLPRPRNQPATRVPYYVPSMGQKIWRNSPEKGRLRNGVDTAFTDSMRVTKEVGR